MLGDTHSTPSYQTRLNLSGADIKSDTTAALYFTGTTSEATISHSTLTGSYAAYAANSATINLNNSQLDNQNNGPTPTYTLVATNGGVINLSQSNHIINSGNRLAMLASDAGQITASGNITSYGLIEAKNNSSIDFDLNQAWINAAFLKDATSQINWRDSGSTWNVTGNSGLNTLTLGDQSSVDMSGISAFVLLELDELASHASRQWPIFTMKADIATHESDFIKVATRSSGDFWVDVPNDAAQANDGLQVLEIIDAANSGASFTSTKKIELGGYYYTLARNQAHPNVWQLEPTVGPSPPPPDPTEPNPPTPPDDDLEPEVTSTGRGGANVALASYLMNYASQQSLVDRLSVARINPSERGGWTRLYHGKVDLKTARIRDSELTYNGLQVGHDQMFYSTPEAYWLAGAMLEYVRGNQGYQTGENKLSAYSAGLYLSHFYDNGLYFDGLLKYSALRNRVSTTDTENPRSRATTTPTRSASHSKQETFGTLQTVHRGRFFYSRKCS